MIGMLMYYLNFPFVQRALIAGVLIAMCSALLGVILVLRGFSYIGDGLSHAAFGAMAVAAVLKLSNNSLLILPVTVICALILFRFGSSGRVHGDAALAVMSVSTLAAGYLIMNVFSVSANVSGDVCTTLFGSTSILTLTRAQVQACLLMSVLSVLVFVLFFHRIFAVIFDEDLARASGIPVRAYQTLIAVLIAVIIVMAMDLVGSLLITALLIFPALSAMQLFGSFRGTVVYAALLSMLGAGCGIILSILASTPVGATVVLFDMGVFFLHFVIGKIRG